MKLNTLTGLFIALAATAAFAQPPEEVPPPPETPEVVAPAAPAPIPVAEPTAAPALAKPAEDNRIKGVTLSPSVALRPFGFDNIGISGDRERARYWFALVPGVDLSMAFKTADGRTINFSGGYSFTWREYYNKDVTKRDFEHDASVAINIPWTDRFSMSADMAFSYFFKAGTDTGADNNIYFATHPALGFKANDRLSFKLGYEMEYQNNIDQMVTADGQNAYSDPPDDLDSLLRGDYTTTATGAPNYGSFGTDLFGSDTITTSSTPANSFKILSNRIFTGVSYKATSSTTLSLGYKFIFAEFCNFDQAEAKWGHTFSAGIIQQFPWGGGSVSLTNEIRFKKMKYNTVEGTDEPAQNFRNRLKLAFDQAITSNMAFEGFYWLQITGKNANNYTDLTHDHWGYMGVRFTF